MRKIMSAAMAAILLVCALAILPVHGEAGIYDNVIRLHVLANSDSEEDQAVKLQVRDAVLARTKGLLDGITSREEAERVLRAALPDVESAARECLTRLGRSDAVSVTLEKEEYPRRTYEAMAFPAGEYLSLRVQLGAAAGQNWWCVMFPPLCLSAASAERETTCLSAGLTKEQYRLITQSEGGKYKLRFKILEIAENALN